jgi:repressor LexA
MIVPILTPKQKQLLDFIDTFREKNGYAPSQHEIARHFGFKSLGTVQNYLVRLERQGALTKVWNARRGTQVVAPQPQATSGPVPLPLVGRVAAGRPIEAIAHSETVDVPAAMIKAARGGGTGTHFVLRVAGDSMIDDGILDGDAVVIRKQAHAENGQTVVALIDNEATIKRFHKKGGVIELHAANPKYRPIVVTEDQGKSFKIEGILAGVIRICR